MPNSRGRDQAGLRRAVRRWLSKAPVREIARNVVEALYNQELATTALGNGKLLSLVYHGKHRVVEVHTVGVTPAGRAAMSVYQVDGQSNSGVIPDWRFFYFDECFDVALLDRPSAAPRAYYNKGARRFRWIAAEV